jgi:hypothetical protein
VQADEDTLYCLMRALASVGVFRATARRTFENTPQSTLLRSEHPDSVQRMARYFTQPHLAEAWAHLEHSVRTGELAFEHAFGEQIFDYLAAHPTEALLSRRW